MLLKNIGYIIFLLTAISCSEDIELTFIEDNFTLEEFAIIEVNFPKAEGNSDISNKINTTIRGFVAKSIDLSEHIDPAVSIRQAASNFDNEYKLFAQKFTEVAQPWEAFVDGEVTYNSPEVISIAMNTYLNTGGAHGNSIISFLNFNPSTGELYTKDDVINYLDKFHELVEKHFKKTIKEVSNSDDNSIPFKLPETIGFSEEGIIIVYNRHELEAYSKNMLEFTIPYNEVSKLLHISL